MRLALRGMRFGRACTTTAAASVAGLSARRLAGVRLSTVAAAAARASAATPAMRLVAAATHRAGAAAAVARTPYGVLFGTPTRALSNTAVRRSTDPQSTQSSASSASSPASGSGSGSGSGNSGGILERLSTTLFNNRDRLRTYLVYASILGGAILILKGGVWLVEFFGNINFADVGEVAYVAGIVSGFAIVAVVSAGKRLVSIRPEPVYRMILKNVTCNPKVQHRLGESLGAGKFRAYSVIEGGLRLRTADSTKYDGWQRWWKPKRIQMLFTVTGSRGTGMVSAEVQNDVRGRPFYRILALDVLDGKGERVVLEGDPTYRVDHGPIKLN